MFSLIFMPCKTKINIWVLGRPRLRLMIVSWRTEVMLFNIYFIFEVMVICFHMRGGIQGGVMLCWDRTVCISYGGVWTCPSVDMPTHNPDARSTETSEFWLPFRGRWVVREWFLGLYFSIAEVSFVQAKKELAIAEGFKQDYNFLWRLLGRVHAARAAIQGLMGEEVK